MTTKVRKPSLVDKLKTLPPGTARRGNTWIDRLSPKARQSFAEIKAAYKQGELVCGVEAIRLEFFKQFPNEPRVERCQFERNLKREG